MRFCTMQDQTQSASNPRHLSSSDEDEKHISSYNDVVVAGASGRLVITSHRWAFLIKKRGVNESTSTFELRNYFPLHAWTSTERSKKTAKARFNYVEASGPLSLVADFTSDRQKMDSCCASLQQQAILARRQPMDVKCPEEGLNLGEEILKFQSVLQSVLQSNSQDLSHMHENAIQTPEAHGIGEVGTAKSAFSYLSSEKPCRATGFQSGIYATGGEKAQAGTSEDNKISATSHGMASHVDSSRFGKNDKASTISDGSKPSPEATFAALVKQAKLSQNKERRILEQQILDSNLELRKLYDSIVIPQSSSSDRSQQAAKNGGVLTNDEFWAIHESYLAAYKPQLAPQPPCEMFLSRPPKYEAVCENSVQDGSVLDAGVSVKGRNQWMVDCSENMLEAFLAEDQRVADAYATLVTSGRLTKETFWSRVLRSKYFQDAIGLPLRCNSLDELPAEEGISFLDSKHSEGDANVARCTQVQQLVGLGEDLISTETLHVKGFGTADGLCSLAGAAGTRPAHEDAGSFNSYERREPRTVNLNALCNRFNEHSEKLLLKQVMPPKIAEAATNRKLGQQDQVLLRLEQKKLDIQSSINLPAYTSVAGKRKLVLNENDVASRDRRMFEGIILDDLEDAPPDDLPQLGVTRRQMYVAGARRSVSNVKGVNENCESNSADAESPYDPQEIISMKNNFENSVKQWLENDTNNVAFRILIAFCECEQQVSETEIAETGRFMFVYNTKMCQKNKAARLASFEYEMPTVAAVRVHQSRIIELLRHFYASTLPEETKRTRIINALNTIATELQQTQDSGWGPCSGAATKALCMPLLDQITTAKLVNSRIRQVIENIRALRSKHQKTSLSQNQLSADNADSADTSGTSHAQKK